MGRLHVSRSRRRRHHRRWLVATAHVALFIVWFGVPLLGWMLVWCAAGTLFAGLLALTKREGWLLLDESEVPTLRRVLRSGELTNA